MKIPCKQCPVLAICRYKEFDNILSDCHKMLRMLYFDNSPNPGARAKNYNQIVLSMEKQIKPTEWYVIIDKANDALIKWVNNETNSM